MDTSLGAFGTGTTWDNFLRGKNKYDNGVTTTWVTDITTLIKDLNNGADVEMWVSWGKKANGNSLGGHCAFVHDITMNSDGSYTVTYYDTFDQVATTPSADQEHITVLPGGHIAGYGIGATFFGAYVEVPEPSTFALLGIGLALVGYVARRRAKA
jgi:hypothetical protein